MTEFTFSVHTYPDEPELWLRRPVGIYKQIIDEALKPCDGVKQIDLCCGLGFGKTLLAIQIAAIKLDLIPGTKILFLEPDWDRVESIFLDTWEEHVPPDLYTINVGRRRITWRRNGNVLHYRARVITGSREAARSKRRGVEYTDVIDDEAALQFDLEQYQNTLARVRRPSPCRTYITLTTPLVGAYARFLRRGGNVVFHGKTRDNHYLLERDPTYEQRLRAAMSPEQARRELDGELVALEGRIWKYAKYHPTDSDCAWPEGNRHDQWTEFRPGEPWWLFCDIGSATGAFAVVQCADSFHHGRELFADGSGVWVAVADLCPHKDANAARAFHRLRTEFGTPVAVVGGADINTAVSTDGRTVSYFARQTWGNEVNVIPCSERRYAKQVQFDQLSYLMCNTLGERRFAIAKNFRSLDEESHRGIREMIDEDAWPADDKRRPNDVLPKGRENIVQHIRDALLMGASMVMRPPRWQYEDHPTA